MENRNNNKGVIALLIILFLLVLYLGGYIAYEKVLSNKETSAENTTNNDDTISDNIESNSIIDVSKFGAFKNTDGSYGRYDMLNFENWNKELSYTIALSLDGNVEINDNKKGWNWKKININEVVDIISFNDDPSGLGYSYMLTKKNEVYYYDLSKATKNNYEVEKVDDATGIVKLIKVSYCPIENAGCAWGLLGIKKDGNYITLGNGSI